jgi:cytochrome b561/polyisoprenoid-binding protein YceI
MALHDTAESYGSLTKLFHWLTALLILLLLPLGWYANQLPFETDAELARKAWFFSLHKTLGVSLFFVALARILWALTQRRPALLNADRRAEALAAQTVHWLLYGALVVVPLSGWISHAAAEGFAPIWWPLGQSLPLVPKSLAIEEAAGTVHRVAARLLILALLLHLAGALKHHLIDGDATLRRMLPGRTRAAGPGPRRHGLAPLGLAALAWAATLGLGLALSPAPHAPAPGEAPLAEVPSDWEVLDGRIEITVRQFGSEVTGHFADWRAAISFDPEAPGQEVGAVSTTIAIPSLSLGSVTQQAMGADFFDADSFATASFDATLLRAVDGYEAVGTLTIKDQSVPVTLPFSLSLNEGLAEMRGDLVLDRRSFGIGDNMKDEASLAFSVKVKVTLTARHAAGSA